MRVMFEEEELARLFHKVSLVEMHHLDIFAHLAKLLGHDPRLWKQEEKGYVHWNAGYNHYGKTRRR